MAERTSEELFARWLVIEGLAEERPGYGHATGEQIAERVFECFDVQIKELECPHLTDDGFCLRHDGCTCTKEATERIMKKLEATDG